MVTGTAPELDIRIHDLIDPKKCYDVLSSQEEEMATRCLLSGMHFESCEKERTEGFGSPLPEVQVQ